MKFILLFALSIFLLQADEPPPAGAFSITRIHYSGGGDWYSDPSSLPNLLDFIATNTGIAVDPLERRARIGDELFSEAPHLYLTGHGNIRFSDEEAETLREHLIRGAFLHADDNYGMDKSFRREMAKVFPEKDWVELPPNHPVFHVLYDFEALPKVHEHDKARPQALGIFHDDRLVVLYSYESDLGDGWEDENVHKDPAEVREAALKMGTNIALYSMLRP